MLTKNAQRQDCIKISSPNHRDLVSQAIVTVEVYLGFLRWMAPFSIKLSAPSGNTETFRTITPNGMKTAGHSGAQSSFTMFRYQTVCILSISTHPTALLEKSGRLVLCGFYTVKELLIRQQLQCT